MLWLVLLPFRLALGFLLAIALLPLALLLLPLIAILWIPFVLLKLAFRLVIGLLAIPVLLVLGCVGIFVGGLAAIAAALPLLMLALLAGLVWMLVRRPARALQL